MFRTIVNWLNSMSNSEEYRSGGSEYYGNVKENEMPPETHTFYLPSGASTAICGFPYEKAYLMAQDMLIK